MTTDTPYVQTLHAQNLMEFGATANGNRNQQLNTQAIKSFALALGDDNLSVTQVQSDFMAAAKALGLAENEITSTLKSALSGANPREPFSANGKQPTQTMSKDNLMLAPTYTALEDYALAHGTPVTAFEAAKWREGVKPSGKYQGAKCLIVPHEDNVERVRFLDMSETDDTKWMPIGSGHKPCWYGFNKAVTKAVASKHKTLVLCNGQPSVITAQHYGIPALAQTDGEGKLIETPLLKRLLAATTEHKLKMIIAMDGDETGRKSASDRQAQLQANGIPVQTAQFGGDDGYDLADFCKDYKQDAFVRLQRLARFSNRTLAPIVCGKELTIKFEHMLKWPTKTLPPGEMIITPMAQLHSLGGLAKMLQPAMMTEVIGPSGGGKTSFMETWIDLLRQAGYDLLWYSPEWSPLVMHLRTIQRHGGACADAIWDSVLWYKEQADGIPEGQRKGHPMKPDSDAGRKALLINEEIKTKWPGDIHCFQSDAVTETILEQMTGRLQILRRHGRKVGIAFFDYAQLLHTVTEIAGRNSYEIIVGMIKRWCIANHIHAVIGSQVTKEVATQAIAKKRLLGKYDSSWVAPNEFNLILSLNIVHDGVDEITQAPIKTNRALINVCKNSTGREDVIQAVTDFKHLRWIDKEWENKSAVASEPPR